MAPKKRGAAAANNSAKQSRPAKPKPASPKKSAPKQLKIVLTSSSSSTASKETLKIPEEDDLELSGIDEASELDLEGSSEEEVEVDSPLKPTKGKIQLKLSISNSAASSADSLSIQESDELEIEDDEEVELVEEEEVFFSDEDEPEITYSLHG